MNLNVAVNINIGCCCHTQAAGASINFCPNKVICAMHTYPGGIYQLVSQKMEDMKTQEAEKRKKTGAIDHLMTQTALGRRRSSPSQRGACGMYHPRYINR